MDIDMLLGPGEAIKSPGRREINSNSRTWVWDRQACRRLKVYRAAELQRTAGHEGPNELEPKVGRAASASLMPGPYSIDLDDGFASEPRLDNVWQ